MQTTRIHNIGDKNENNVTREERVVIQQMLGYGDLTRIAKVADVSIKTVWNWFKCESDNNDVYNAVVVLLEKKESDRNKRLNNL